MINPMDLTGKHILITGGSSGIGRQCAIQASRLGARVSVIARREDALRETLSQMENPSLHAYFPADLSETESIENLVRTIVVRKGPADGFCHAAGIGTGRTLKMSKPNYVEKMFRIHTFAFYELIRCLTLKDYANDGASFVGISSVAAEKGNPTQEVYGSAKAAMNSFLRPVSAELAKRRIRVNAVAYAMVSTPMFDEFKDNGGDERIMKRQYLGVIDPGSAANAVMFLLSDASRFITASVLPVYAGC